MFIDCDTRTIHDNNDNNSDCDNNFSTPYSYHYSCHNHCHYYYYSHLPFWLNLFGSFTDDDVTALRPQRRISLPVTVTVIAIVTVIVMVYINDECNGNDYDCV